MKLKEILSDMYANKSDYDDDRKAFIAGWEALAHILRDKESTIKLSVSIKDMVDSIENQEA